MKPKTRSISGATLMLIIIPVIVGLLACMPEVVPLGNPERARIDPELSGVWVMGTEDEVVFVLYFDPYDKRTWLVFCIGPEEGDELDLGEDTIDTYDDMVEILTDEVRGVGSKGITASEVSTYKSWTTKLRGETFLIWVPKGQLRDDGTFGVDFAWNWHLKKITPTHFEIRFINFDDPIFEDVDLTNRRALEKVIRKNVNNEALYDDEVFSLIKVKPEHLDAFGDLLHEVTGLMM